MVTERYSSTSSDYAEIRFSSEFFCSTYPHFISQVKKNINLVFRFLEQYLGSKILELVECFKGGD